LTEVSRVSRLSNNGFIAAQRAYVLLLPPTVEKAPRNVSSYGPRELEISTDNKTALAKESEPTPTANTARTSRRVLWSQADEELLFFCDRGYP